LANVEWPVLLFILAYHVGLLVGLPLYFAHETPGIGLVVTSIVLLFLTEIGIGGAYHRYYAHRCYELSRPAEWVLLFLATLAVQGSAIQWSHDHRRHHTFVDSDDDPYSIRKGFWFAHCLWLFHKQPPLDEKWVRDLIKRPLLRFQHKYVNYLGMGANALVWLAVGFAFSDFLGAFVLAWWTRLAVSHHFTWFVNSLAHTWGERTYSRELSAVDNYILAFLTVGEGYHNYHHTFASDYRNGVRWYHFDPTKWTIWTLSKLGLARNLKRFNAYRIRTRLLAEDKKLLLDALRERAHLTRVELEGRVQGLAETLQAKLARVRALGEELKKLGRSKEERAARRALRRELREVEQSLKRDWRSWSRLCGTVLDAPALSA
jgi:stearoyl-CoA desaturase (delta-9 desaturase)